MLAQAHGRGGMSLAPPLEPIAPVTAFDFSRSGGRHAFRVPGLGAPPVYGVRQDETLSEVKTVRTVGIMMWDTEPIGRGNGVRLHSPFIRGV